MAGERRVKRGWGLLTLAVVMIASSVFAAGGARAAAPVLDQSQTACCGLQIFGGTTELAQTFTAGVHGRLVEVAVNIERGIFVQDLTVEITTTSGGFPTSTVLATTTIAGTSVPNGATWVPVTFAPTAPSITRTQYAIVLSSQPELDFAWLTSSGGNQYSGGQGLVNTGGGWTTSGAPFSFDFKTYVIRGDASNNRGNGSQQA